MKRLSTLMAFIFSLILLVPVWAKHSDNNYEDILFKMKERFEQIESYQCLFEAFTAKREKTKVVISRYFFKKPNMVRMEILKGKHKGTVLLYKPHRVRLKLGKGLLSMFSFTLEPEDKRLIDLRGHGLHQSAWDWFIDQHIQLLELTESTFSGEETVDRTNTLVFMLSFKDPENIKFIAKETLWVDKEDFIPVKYILYDSEGIIIQSLRYRDIEINIDLKDELFKKFRKTKRK